MGCGICGSTLSAGILQISKEFHMLICTYTMKSLPGLARIAKKYPSNRLEKSLLIMVVGYFLECILQFSKVHAQ